MLTKCTVCDQYIEKDKCSVGRDECGGYAKGHYGCVERYFLHKSMESQQIPKNELDGEFNNG